MESRSKLALLAAVLLSIAAARSTATGPAEESAAPELVQARAALAGGDPRTAIIQLKNLLISDPNNALVRLTLGEAYLDLDRGAEAEKELRRAGELGIERSRIAVSLAQALLVQGNSQRLVEEFQDAAALPGSGRAEVLALRGDAYMALNRATDAAADYAAAIALEQGNVRALVGEARLAASNNDTRTARSKIEQVLAANPQSAQAWSALGDLAAREERLAEAETAYTKAIENSSVSPSDLLKRAKTRAGIGNIEGARQDIDAVKQVIPGDLVVDLAEGILSFRERKLQEARTAFERVLAGSPDNPEALAYLGAVDYGLGNLEQAEAQLSRASAANPDARDTLRLLGLTRFRRGDYPGAIEVMQPLVNAYPDDAVAVRVLGRSLIESGRVDAGQAHLRRAVELDPKGAAQRADLAAGLLLQGDRTTAIAELEEAVEIDPSLDRAEVMLFRSRLTGGEAAQAIAVAKRLTATHPESPTALIYLGMAQSLNGNIEGARASFEGALKLTPGLPQAAHKLAVLALREGNSDKARSIYLEALGHHPGNLKVLMDLARFEARQGNIDAYRGRLVEAIQQNPKALEPRILLARQQLADRDPRQALVTLEGVEPAQREGAAYLFELSRALLDAGQASNAVIPSKKLVELYPNVAEGWALFVRLHREIGALGQAQEKLLDALRQHPDGPLTGRLIGYIAAAADDPDQLGSLLESVKLIAPKNSQVVDFEGQFALRRQDPQKAAKIYGAALETDPGDPTWVLRLAEVQGVLGDTAARAATLERGVKKFPRVPELRQALADTYLALNRPKDAVAAYRALVVQDPNNAMALNNLAWLIREGEPQKAREFAEKAHRIAPNAVAKDTLAMILLDQGEPANALKLLQEAVAAGPADPSIRYHLALALKRTGQDQQAKAELVKLLAEGGPFPDRQAAEALLKSL